MGIRVDMSAVMLMRSDVVLYDVVVLGDTH